MHYRNGREAKPGDHVVNLETGGNGLTYNLVAGSNACNGRLAKMASGDEYVTLKNCIHIDDLRAMLDEAKAEAKSA